MPRIVAGNRPKVRNFGTCLSFNGTSDKVVTALWSASNTAGTLSAWFRTRNHKQTRQPIISNGDGASGALRGHAIVLSGNSSTDGSMYFLNHNVAWINLGFKVQDSRWHHIVVVINSSTSVTSYLDGVSKGTVSSISPALGTPNTASLIGTDNTASGFFFGEIDEARYHTTSLTSGEVTRLYLGTAPITTPANWYKFDEGSGSIALDSGSSPLDGTITGATYSSDVVSIARTVPNTIVGTAYKFNGSPDKVSFGNILLTNTVVTATQWIKITATPSGNFEVPFGYGNQRWFLIFNGASTQLGFHIKAGGVEKASAYTSALTLDTWYLVAGTYDPNAGASNINVYAYNTSGTQVSTGTATVTGAMDSTASSLEVAHDPNRNYFNRIVSDEVRVYGRVLAPSELANLAQQIEPSTAELLLRAPFDESSGTTVYNYRDLSSTGTLTGSTRVVGIIYRNPVRTPAA